MLKVRQCAAFALLAVLLVPGAPAWAQGDGNRIGLIVGANFSRLGGSGIQDASSRLGLMFGLYGSFMEDMLGLSPQLLYTQKGAEKAVSTSTLGEVALNYLEFPLLVKAVIPTSSNRPVNPHFLAGPAVSYLLDCSVVISNVSNTKAPCETVGFYPYNWDVGFVIGAGIDGRGFSLGARYEIGILSIAKNETIKNRVLSITFAYGFRFGGTPEP
jgi:Outer membrane protein beta-barrel domain